MNIDDLLNRITPELYQTLRQSLELGKWPNGRCLTSQQKETVLQAMIVYEHQSLPETEHTGYMPDKCQSTVDDNAVDRNGSKTESIIRFKP